MLNFREWIIQEELDLSYLLSPVGQVPQIGIEKAFPKGVVDGFVKYVSPHGSYRYIYFVDGKAVSVLQVVSRDKKSASIANVYTLPEFRRHGYAKMLFNRVKEDFRSLEHSKDLSDLGILWSDKVK